MLRLVCLISLLLAASCNTTGAKKSSLATSGKNSSSNISPSSDEPVRAPNDGYVYKKLQAEGKVAELLFDEMLVRYSEIKLYRKSFTKKNNVKTIVFMENGPHYLRCDKDSNNKFQCDYYRPSMYFTKPFAGEFSEILSNAILRSQGQSVNPYVPYDHTQEDFDRTSQPLGVQVNAEDLFSGSLICKCIEVIDSETASAGVGGDSHKEFECRFK